MQTRVIDLVLKNAHICDLSFRRFVDLIDCIRIDRDIVRLCLQFIIVATRTLTFFDPVLARHKCSRCHKLAIFCLKLRYLCCAAVLGSYIKAHIIIVVIRPDLECCCIGKNLLICLIILFNNPDISLKTLIYEISHLNRLVGVLRDIHSKSFNWVEVLRYCRLTYNILAISKRYRLRIAIFIGEKLCAAICSQCHCPILIPDIEQSQIILDNDFALCSLIVLWNARKLIGSAR